jgi:hypothetical protein
VINTKIIDQIDMFNYLGCSLSYEREKDITTKVSKFLQITGIINQVLKPSKVEADQVKNIQHSSYTHIIIW